MKLLLVDDDPEFMLIASFIFRKDGRISVIEACGSLSGIEKAEIERPDAVVSDYRMAGMDGVQMMAEIRSRPGLENLPFIFCSGKNDAGFQEKIAKAGAIGRIKKPFNPDTIVADILAILSGASDRPPC